MTDHAASRLSRLLGAAGLALGLSLAVTTPVHAQARKPHAHAHVHGEVELGVAIEGPTIIIELQTPLDNLIGFERAPRTDTEKNTVEQTVALLRAADQLFRIDPAAGCKLGPVALEAPVLGLGAAPATPSADEHAELLGSFAFNCTSAEQARFIELDFFKAFKNVRQIDAEIVTGEGQHKRSLKRPANRLSWSP